MPETTFKATLLPLAAAILASVPESTLITMDRAGAVNGRVVFVLGIPTPHQPRLHEVLSAFHARRLTVDLAAYNTQLNRLRDALMHREVAHVLPQS